MTATNVPNIKIFCQGDGEIWYQKGKKSGTEQDDTHKEWVLTLQPSTQILQSYTWLKAPEKGYSTDYVVIDQFLLVGIIQANQFTEKGKKAAVQKEWLVSAQPVGQNWWVRTWNEAWDGGNPTG